MTLKILLPRMIFLEENATKVNAEGSEGGFCLLPHHIDFVTAIVPGILSYETEDGGERFVAVDAGILVKKDTEVIVSVRNAVGRGELGTLKRAVTEQFREYDEREHKARSVLAKLEADFARRFLEAR